ncbi:MAG: hypothetical protein ACOYN2_06095 [Patescibacteria group bacterium]
MASGSYPQPDNQFAVTYSGATVWTQGTVGSGVIRVMGAGVSGGGLNTTPLDPLSKTEYKYSVLAYGNSYQIGASYEDSHSTALVRGNYGGIASKTQTGGLIYALALPSILTNT